MPTNEGWQKPISWTHFRVRASIPGEADAIVNARLTFPDPCELKSNLR
jgi:hypothetical protein